MPLLSNLHLPAWLSVLIIVTSSLIPILLTILGDIKNSRKENIIQVIVHKILIPIWLLTLLFGLIAYFIILYFNLKYQSAPVVLPASTEQKSELAVQNSWQRLINNLEKWDLGEVYTNNEGYYCPRGKPGDYNFRTLWFRKSMPVALKNLEIRFTVRKDQKQLATVKAVVEFGKVFSKDYKVSNFYLPFDGSEGVNYERYVENDSFEFLPNPGELQLPIEDNTPVKITIDTKSISGNTVLYEYRVEYIPKGEDSSITKSFHYSVSLQDPSPRELIMDFGIGIFYGGCLSDIEYLFE